MGEKEKMKRVISLLMAVLLIVPSFLTFTRSVKGCPLFVQEDAVFMTNLDITPIGHMFYDCPESSPMPVLEISPDEESYVLLVSFYIENASVAAFIKVIYCNNVTVFKAAIPSSNIEQGWNTLTMILPKPSEGEIHGVRIVGVAGHRDDDDLEPWIAVEDENFGSCEADWSSKFGDGYFIGKCPENLDWYNYEVAYHFTLKTPGMPGHNPYIGSLTITSDKTSLSPGEPFTVTARYYRYSFCPSDYFKLFLKNEATGEITEAGRWAAGYWQMVHYGWQTFTITIRAPSTAGIYTLKAVGCSGHGSYNYYGVNWSDTRSDGGFVGHRPEELSWTFFEISAILTISVGVSRKFDPYKDGFSFSNNEFTEKVVKSLEEIKQQFEMSPISSEIPQIYWLPFELSIHALIMMQMGYCGGMTITAREYYENPQLLPQGYSYTRSIPFEKITETSTFNRIVLNQWWTQIFRDNYFLKWWLIRLGNGPSGLVPFNAEINWILQQLDQNKTVDIIAFLSSEYPWFLSHALLAYDYKPIGDKIYLYVYGPNSMGTQIIFIKKDSDGNYILEEQLVDCLPICRIGSRDGPLFELIWNDVLAHAAEIILHIIEYVMQKATEYASQLINWIKEHLKDLWGHLNILKVQFPDTWNRFVSWVSDKAKDVYNRIIHFKLHSFAVLHVYNSEGKHAGPTSTGDLDLEFDALYLVSNEMQYCAVLVPLTESYKIELVGTDQGSYSLNIIFTIGGASVSEQTFSGEIVYGAIYVYSVNIIEDEVNANPEPNIELEHLKEFIIALSPNDFRYPKLEKNYKIALSCKINEVILKVAAGNYTDAINKLLRDIRAKVDGDFTAEDWIINPATQLKLCVIIDHIISNIETLRG